MVSAVGHETDFTIADFVADLRAPTPSAAAELITEAQHKIAEHLATQSHRLERAARFQLLQARQRLTRLPVSRAESRVSTLLTGWASGSTTPLSAWTPRSLAQLRSRQNRVAELAAAVLRHDPRQKLAHAREHLADFRARLDRSLERLLQSSAASFSALDARLHSLSPLAVLDRGYALVLSADGALVRSTAQIAAATASPRAWPMAPSSAASNRQRRARTRPTRTRHPLNEARNRHHDRNGARKLFGTDGIRAVAGESPLDPTTIYGVGLALAHSLRKTAAEPKVLLGRDTRESGPWIAATLAAGLREAGARWRARAS